MGPSLGLDVLENRKISCPDRDSNSEISTHELKVGADVGMRQMAQRVKKVKCISRNHERGLENDTVHRVGVQNAE